VFLVTQDIATVSIHTTPVSTRKDNSGTRIQPIPAWAQSWFDMKIAKGLKTGSLARYSYDIKELGMDVTEASVQEIRHRLAELPPKYATGVLRHIAICAKAILREADREKDAQKIPLLKHSKPRVVAYSDEEIEQILQACNTIRDRLLITILVELGPRRQELFNMRLKDVQFDDKSAILWFDGKTGRRRRRLFRGEQNLVAYMSVHPNKADPEAKFWVNRYGKPLAYEGFYKLVHRLGLRGGHHVFPHGFRHTAATRDVQQYTDREMMIRHGWNRAEMVGVYAHISGRDVEEKELALRGFKGSRTCRRCGNVASLTAKFCERCGRSLGG
jgi:integrase